MSLPHPCVLREGRKEDHGTGEDVCYIHVSAGSTVIIILMTCVKEELYYEGECGFRYPHYHHRV